MILVLKTCYKNVTIIIKFLTQTQIGSGHCLVELTNHSLISIQSVALQIAGLTVSYTVQIQFFQMLFYVNKN